MQGVRSPPAPQCNAFLTHAQGFHVQQWLGKVYKYKLDIPRAYEEKTVSRSAARVITPKAVRVFFLY